MLGAAHCDGRARQRMAVRVTWGRATPEVILPCFLIGQQVKRTPRSPWDKHRAAEQAEPDGGPRGELSPLPEAEAIRQEHAKHGDVLMLPGSAEIHAGGTSGLKTLTWWKHVTAHMPNAEWVGNQTLTLADRLRHGRLPARGPQRAPLRACEGSCISANACRRKMISAETSQSAGRGRGSKERFALRLEHGAQLCVYTYVYIYICVYVCTCVCSRG